MAKYPGFTDQQARVLDDLVARAAAAPAAPGRILDRRRSPVAIRPVPGDTVRAAANDVVVLPHPSTARGRAPVTVLIEDAPVTVLADSGTVNDVSKLAVNTLGAMAFYTTGTEWWGSAAGGSAGSGGAPLDAEYIVGVAAAELPSARVATASTEITPDVGTPSVISWVLNAASVAYSKLANLTGLSVLGRAADSAGVMAAITAASAKQVLRNRGDQLHWEYPVTVGSPFGWVFDGVDDFISAGDVLDMERTTPRSIFFWYATTSTAGPVVVGKQANGTAVGWRFAVSNANLDWILRGSSQQLQAGLATPAPLDGSMHMLGMTYDGSSSAAGVEFYLDAASAAKTIGTNNLTSQVTSNAANFTVGARGAANAPFTGGIQHVSIWNRVLTPSEVAQLSNGGEPADLSALSFFSDCILWYKLDENDATGAGGIVDYSASNFDGTAQGGLALSSGDEQVHTLVEGGGVDLSVLDNVCTVTREAITGAVSASAGSNVTQFSGIRDNGSLETARGFLNLVNSTSVTLTGTQDAGNDEIEITAHIDGIDDAVNGTALLSNGSGGSAWNYAVTVFDSGASQGRAGFLNFVAGTNINLAASVSSGFATITPSVDLSSVTYTAGSRLTLTGLEFNVKLDAAFAWTGVHTFTSSTFSVATTGDVDINAGSGLALTAGLTSDITAIDAGDIVVAAASGMQIGVGATAGNAIDGSADVGDLSVTVDADVSVSAGVDISAHTAGTERVRLKASGEIQLASDPGAVGEVITSAAAGAPPTWRPLIAPPQHYILRDDFTGGAQGFSVPTYGETGWFYTRNTDGSSEDVIGIQSEAGHPGILRLLSDNTSTTNAQVVLLRGLNISGGTNGNAVHCDDLQEFSWVVRPVFAAARRIYVWGMSNTPDTVGGSSGTSGVYLFWDTNNSTLGFRVVNNGTVTTDNLTTGLAGGEWINCTVKRDGALWTVAASVDGGSAVTGDVPVGSDSLLWQPYAKIWRVSGANSGFKLDVDLYSVFATPSRGD